MQEYDNTNTGSLFKNDQKATENHPDYKGSVNANGQEFWLSAWIKTSKAGKKYMSLSLTAKEQEAPKPAARPVRQAKPVDDDEPPF